MTVNLPRFVHDDLKELTAALEPEGAGKTSLVGALIHSATAAGARKALRKYKVDEVAFRRASAKSEETN